MALTLFEDFIYWTDGKSKSLRRAHKTTAAQGMELLNSWQAIKSIKVYHSLRQPEGITSICHSCPFGPPMLSSCMVVRGERFLMSFCPSVQYPNTSVRLQMEDAATCVSYPLVGDTNVLVPLIFTWLLTIRPAYPTAPPVRSALPFFPIISSLVSLCCCFSFPTISVLSLKANSFTLICLPLWKCAVHTKKIDFDVAFEEC